MAQFKWLAPARWATADNAFSNTETDLALRFAIGFWSCWRRRGRLELPDHRR